MKPHILFSCKDHPLLNSGYGIVARYLLPRLGDHYGRENITIYAPVYQRDHVSEWEGMKVVAGTEWGFGENLILEHYERHNCNLLIMLGDAWPLGVVPDLAAQDKVLWVQWIPVDWLGMPKNIRYRIQYAHKLVPFSKHGEASLRKAGFPNVEPAIWLGLNTDLWKPIPREDLPQVMYLLGYSYDSFNILIVAANQERKQVRPALEAIAAFRIINPQADVRLYLHSHLLGDRDMRADLDELDLKGISNSPDPYLMTQGGAPEGDMVMVFNCADVLIDVAMEGFGFPVLQAQAVGVPAIVLSEGASPELTVFGIEVPVSHTETSAHQMAQPKPNTLAIARAIGELYEKRMAYGAPLRSPKAIEFVRENFGWDRIAAQWFGVIDRCMEDRVRYCMDIPNPAGWLDETASRLVEVQ